MTTLVTRAEWGAAPPRSVSHNVTPTEGVAIHHVGAGSYAYQDHDRCKALVLSIQRMHMSNTSEGYVDIAYSLLACHHGFIFEGRSKADDPKVRPGSNGTSHANTVSMSVCCLWGDADGDPNPGILAAAAGGVAWLRENAKAADRVTGHRDWSSTGCPGHLYPKLGTIKALADRANDVPDRDERAPIKVATYNCPRRYGIDGIKRDLKVLRDKGVSVIALQEVGDNMAVQLAKSLSWDWWRPAKAQSAAIIFDPDLFEPVRRADGRRKQGAFRVNAVGANDRFVVWAFLRHRPTKRVYRFGSVHLPAFKTRSPKRARQFRHAEHRAAEWLSRGGRRVLMGDFNANKSRIWTPNLNAVARWETPRLKTHGHKRIDHVVASKKGNIRPVALETVDGVSDHRALIVRL